MAEIVEASRSLPITEIISTIVTSAPFGAELHGIETNSTAAYDYGIAGLYYFELSVSLAIDEIGIDSAAYRSVAAYTVANTACVAGDAFTYVQYIAVFCLIRPVRICDKSPLQSDHVCVAAGDYVVGCLRISDVAHCDAWLPEFVPDRLCHIGAPTVLKPTGVDLIMYRLVQTAEGIENIDLIVQIFKIF